MSDPIAERKRVELEKKMSALSSELAVWCEMSAPDACLEKHHSQIVRMGTQLEAAIAELQKRPAAGEPAVNPQQVEESILDLHHVWDFFRSKLVLRTFRHFREYLEIADEFAYACYKPATVNAGDRLKEPPLTFFSTQSTPYATPRNEQYTSERRNRFAMRDAVAVKLLKSLPIPVVALPWFQLGHLPDLAIVAHEAGHHVEDDLSLHDALDESLRKAGIPDDRLEAWLAWRGETFGDVYATRCIGRAFTRALFDFLMTDPDRLRAEVKSAADWGDYPTAVLRLRITAAVLTDANTAEGIDTLLQPFEAHAMKAFEEDCAKVVSAMLATTVPGEARTVRQLIRFAAHNESSATYAAENAAANAEITTRDIRELVAAVVHSYGSDPAGYTRSGDTPSRDQLLRAAMRATIQPGIRDTPAIDLQRESVAAHAAVDRQRGEQLLAALREGKKDATAS
jgi:hypothetical protein